MPIFVGGASASAHTVSVSATGITSTNYYFSPSGSTDDPYNGYKVFLSSPRHADSGSRGECRSPGYEENVNGRQFNIAAANGVYMLDKYTAYPNDHNRNVHARGYQVAVSRNSHDDGYLDNRTLSRNWGANLHIITHTNATSGCGSATQNYLLTMYEDSNDQVLASRLRTELDPYVPGSSQLVHRTDLAELATNASNGDAYVELQMHDVQSTQQWIYDTSFTVAYRYGVAIDAYLGYP
jgi:hypothetical protein